MNAKERDELLIRLDERTAKNQIAIPAIEAHLAAINGHIKGLTVQAEVNKAGIKDNRNLIKALWGVIVLAVGVSVTALVEFWKRMV